MDEPYLLAAAHYVEMNPVKASIIPGAVSMLIFQEKATAS
jgi:hypothetical protein